MIPIKGARERVLALARGIVVMMVVMVMLVVIRSHRPGLRGRIHPRRVRIPHPGRRVG